jgi:hypothetical protein
MNNELGDMLKEAVKAYFNILHRHFLERPKETDYKLQSRQWVRTNAVTNEQGDMLKEAVKAYFNILHRHFLERAKETDYKLQSRQWSENQCCHLQGTKSSVNHGKPC